MKITTDKHPSLGAFATLALVMGATSKNGQTRPIVPEIRR